MAASDDVAGRAAPRSSPSSIAASRSRAAPPRAELFLRTVLGDAAYERMPRVYQERAKAKWAEIRADSAALIAYRPRYAELADVPRPGAACSAASARRRTSARRSTRCVGRAARARLEVDRGAGHMLHAEAHRRFAELVVALRRRAWACARLAPPIGGWAKVRAHVDRRPSARRPSSSRSSCPASPMTSSPRRSPSSSGSRRRSGSSRSAASPSAAPARVRRRARRGQARGARDVDRRHGRGRGVREARREEARMTRRRRAEEADDDDRRRGGGDEADRRRDRGRRRPRPPRRRRSSSSITI